MQVREAANRIAAYAKSVVSALLKREELPLATPHSSLGKGGRLPPPIGGPPRSYAQAAKGAPLPPPLATKIRVQPPTSAPQALPSVPRKADRRLFVRLGEESPYRQMSPHEVAKKVLLSLPADTKITTVQRTATGLAIVPARPQDAVTLVKHAEAVASTLGAATAEQASHWRTVAIYDCPRRLRTLAEDGKTMTTRDLQEVELAGELATVFNAPPKRLFWARNGTTLVVSFLATELPTLPRDPYLFCTRVQLRELPRKQRSAQCTRCWAFHREEHCGRQQVCKVCTSREHTTHPTEKEACRCPPRCANCAGPHLSDSPACPLRPRYCKTTHLVQKPTAFQAKQLRLSKKTGQG